VWLNEKCGVAAEPGDLGSSGTLPGTHVRTGKPKGRLISKRLDLPRAISRRGEQSPRSPQSPRRHICRTGLGEYDSLLIEIEMLGDRLAWSSVAPPTDLSRFRLGSMWRYFDPRGTVPTAVLWLLVGCRQKIEPENPRDICLSRSWALGEGRNLT